MIITVTAYKGGVGKTTTAVHLAGCLFSKGTTLLIDGDANRSVIQWNEFGLLPFDITDIENASLEDYGFVVIDTAARPDNKEINALSANSDLIIVPTTPDALSLRATIPVIDDLSQANYKVLLTKVPPYPSKAGREARRSLIKAKIPVFESEIPRLVAFEKAALQGKLVKQVSDVRVPGAHQAYINLVKEVLNDLR